MGAHNMRGCDQAAKDDCVLRQAQHAAMQRAQQMHLQQQMQQQQLVAQQLISTLSVEQREALARLPAPRQVPPVRSASGVAPGLCYLRTWAGAAAVLVLRGVRVVQMLQNLHNKQLQMLLQDRKPCVIMRVLLAAQAEILQNLRNKQLQMQRQQQAARQAMLQALRPEEIAALQQMPPVRRAAPASCRQWSWNTHVNSAFQRQCLAPLFTRFPATEPGSGHRKSGCIEHGSAALHCNSMLRAYQRHRSQRATCALSWLLPRAQPQQQAALAQLTQRYMEQVAARQHAQAASHAQGYQQAHAQAQHQGQPLPGGQLHPGFAHAGAHVIKTCCRCPDTRRSSVNGSAHNLLSRGAAVAGCAAALRALES